MIDPSKRALVEAQVAEWLRYGDDLGLGPFFRDRAPLESQTARGVDLEAVAVLAAKRAVAAPAMAEPAARPDQENISDDEVSNDMPKGRRTIEAAPSASRVAVVAPGNASTTSAGVLPIVAGVGLFEAFERVEGDSLARIREDIGDCKRCKLHKTRNKIVFGVGNPKAELVFVGEGPGRDEDMQGEPFVGRAGKLLTQMIEAMSLTRGDVYIANVVKCRPPENRLPEKDEIATCSPFLMRQLDFIQPKVICCLGSCSAQTLLQTTQGISKFRGEWFDFRGSKLIATYHPAYLLRNPAAKSEVWKDLQKVMGVLGLKPRKQ